MKESKFIQENVQKWTSVDKAFKKFNFRRKSVLDGTDLGSEYMRLTDDLSFAQTFYSKRSVRVYLNRLVSDMYRLIFKYSESSEGNSVKKFWTVEIPSILYHGRKSFLLSFVIFALAVFIGAFSLSQNAEFAQDILSEGYVQMTDANIQKGDPMAVYKEADSWDMFQSIALNNLKVMTFAFLLGAFFGLGTVGALISNGVMLGVFQYYFYQKGLLWESFLTIWQHGTVEISCIIIGGGAGLLLGSGYLFPGNYSRLLSLRLQFYRGMKVAIAIMPFIIFAAFVEAYITRHDDLDQMLRLMFIVVNALIIFGYFIYMPYRYGRMSNRVEKGPDENATSISYELKETGILNAGEIIQNAVIKTQKFFPKFGGFLFFVVATVTALLYLEENWIVQNIHWVESGGSGLLMAYDFAGAAYIGLQNYFELHQMANLEQSPLYLVPILGVTLGILQTLTVAHLNQTTWLKIWKKSLFHLLFLSAISLGINLGGGYMLIQYAFLVPLAALSFQLSVKDNLSYISAFFKSFNLFFSNFGLTLTWMGMMLLVSVLMAVLIQGSLLGILIHYLNTFISFDNVGDPTITSSIRFFLSFLTLGILYVLAQFGYSFLANTVLESRRADHLLEQIRNIPPRKRRYGIDETI